MSRHRVRKSKKAGTEPTFPYTDMRQYIRGRAVNSRQ